MNQKAGGYLFSASFLLSLRSPLSLLSHILLFMKQRKRYKRERERKGHPPSLLPQASSCFLFGNSCWVFFGQAILVFLDPFIPNTREVGNLGWTGIRGGVRPSALSRQLPLCLKFSFLSVFQMTQCSPMRFGSPMVARRNCLM